MLVYCTIVDVGTILSALEKSAIYSYQLRLAQSKQNLRATCPKGKLEYKFFRALHFTIKNTMYMKLQAGHIDHT